MLHQDKTQMLKKVFQIKKTLQKMHSFFFLKLQLIRVLYLICSLYTSWSTTFISLKVRVAFSIFNSTFIFVFIKVYIFVQQKDHNSVQNKKSIKSNHSFAHRPLTFKMQPETMDLETIFSNLEIPSFEYVTSFAFVTFKWILNTLLLNNLFIFFSIMYLFI